MLDPLRCREASVKAEARSQAGQSQRQAVRARVPFLTPRMTAAATFAPLLYVVVLVASLFGASRAIVSFVV